MSSSVETIMWFARPSAKDNHRVCKKAFGLLHLRIYKSVASTEQEDEDKDTPSDGKTCQRRAQLVVANRSPYLLEEFYHFM
jgi:hypothetical protein